MKNGLFSVYLSDGIADSVLIFFVLLCMFLCFFFIRYYRMAKYLKHREEIKSRLIQEERERISGEIHDDIGSGLTALKLYTEHIGKLKPDVTEIRDIHKMVDEISTKIREIIWTSNADSDYLENLIYFIDEQLRKIFDQSNIKFRSQLPDEIPNLQLESNSKRDCFLITKEVAHNIIKHSKADEVTLLIEIEREQMIISIKDNGIGFDPLEKNSNGMGLINIKERAERLHAGLIIENYKGSRVRLNIPMKHNLNL